MGINSFQAPQGSPIERLAMLMGVVKQGKDTFDSFNDSAIKQADRDKARAEEAAQMDPNSEASKSRRAAQSEFTGHPVAETASAYQLEKDYGPLSGLAAESRKQKFDRDTIGIQHTNAMALKGLEGRQNIAVASAKAQKEATDALNPSKLSATDKQRYDNVVMANKGVNDMFDALAKNQSRYSVFGDNDYTAGLARFKEALGRMQSGGAIQKEEAESFINLARNMGDDETMQYKKLADLKEMMRERYKTLGFDPDADEAMAKKVIQPGQGVDPNEELRVAVKAEKEKRAKAAALKKGGMGGSI